MKKIISALIAITVTGVLFLGCATDSNVWLTDYDAAAKLAKKQKKPLLVNFSGSDWCEYCQELSNAIFSEQEFNDAAGEDFVLCVLDFPQDASQISEEQQEKNMETARLFRIQGFPTIILLTPEGIPYAVTGYEPEKLSPEEYLTHLHSFDEKRYELQNLLDKANNARGIERAAALDELIAACDPSAALVMRPYMQEIVELDPLNEGGYKRPYSIQLTYINASEKFSDGDLEGATADFLDRVNEGDLNGDELQEIYYYVAYINAMGGGDEAIVIDYLTKSIDANPESQNAEMLRMMLQAIVAGINEASGGETAIGE